MGKPSRPGMSVTLPSTTSYKDQTTVYSYRIKEPGLGINGLRGGDKFLTLISVPFFNFRDLIMQAFLPRIQTHLGNFAGSKGSQTFPRYNLSPA